MPTAPFVCGVAGGRPATAPFTANALLSHSLFAFFKTGKSERIGGTGATLLAFLLEEVGLMLGTCAAAAGGTHGITAWLPVLAGLGAGVQGLDSGEAAEDGSALIGETDLR